MRFASVLAFLGALIGINAVSSEVHPVRAAANARMVYVTGRLNQAHVFNGSSNTYIQAISGTSAGAQFNAIVAAPDGSRVYRTAMSENAVKVIDPFTDSVVASIGVMGDPRALAISPDGQSLYVSNLSGSLSKIRTSDLSTSWTVSRGSGTYGMGVSADGAYLYVPNNGTNEVIKLNTSTGAQVAALSTGAGAGTRWVDARNGYIVATNYATHKVSIISETTFLEIGQVATGTNPIGVVISPSGTRAYVAAERSNRVEVIDLVSRTLERSVGIGTRPWGVGVSADDSRIFVGTYQTNSLSVINTSSWAASTIPVTGDQTMTVAVIDVPATPPTTTTTTSTTTTTTSTTVAPTTTTVAPTTTTTIASTTTTAATTTTVSPSSTAASATTSSAPATIAPTAAQSPSAAVPATSSGTTTSVAEATATRRTTGAVAAPVTTIAAMSTTTTSTVPVPAAPDAALGEAAATIGGVEVEAQLSRRDNALILGLGSLSASIHGETADGGRVALDADGNLNLSEGDSVVVSGEGFEASSNVDVWLFSTPTRVGTLAASASGTISGSFPVPSGIESGAHRLVLDGNTADGDPATVGIGLLIGGYATEGGINTWLIVVPIVVATTLGLVIPTTLRRRRRFGLGA